MSQGYDETTLSAFVDGALDTETMKSVEAFVAVDPDARQYVWEAFTTQAKLRAALSPVADERIPPRLLAAVSKPPADLKRRRMPAFVRAAAAVVLLAVGVGLGWMMQGVGNGGAGGFETLPARYSQVVDAALENNLSGKATDWQPPGGRQTVTVTPVRTFKDADGRFYREYTLKISEGKQHAQVNGLAYRVGQGRWQTKALFF
jgi:surface antigen